MQGEDVVRLATGLNPAEVQIYKEALEDEGIRCEVVGTFLDAGLGDIPGLRSEVWVRQADLARAGAVVEALQKKFAATAEREIENEADGSEDEDGGPEGQPE